MSEHPTIQQALAAVMNEIIAVGKDGRNTSQNYNFRGVDAVVNAAGPAFRKHGVVPMPRVLASERASVEVGAKRSLMREVVLKVAYDFHGPAGDVLSCEVEAEALDSGDKATSKAMSVAYRTALLQVLAIPTDDPDPDTQSYERAAAPEPDPAVEAKKRMHDQKKRLLKACGGDGEKAKQLWADRTEATDEELASLIEVAEMTAGEPTDGS